MPSGRVRQAPEAPVQLVAAGPRAVEQATCAPWFRAGTATAICRPHIGPPGPRAVRARLPEGACEVNQASAGEQAIDVSAVQANGAHTLPAGFGQRTFSALSANTPFQHSPQRIRSGGEGVRDSERDSER